MSDNVGKLGWPDMTVDDASGLRDFYHKVVGWKIEDTRMDGYDDYTMMSPDDGEAVDGICHARGGNADLSGGWVILCNRRSERRASCSVSIVTR